MEIFTIRIVYKSGYTHDFECTEFEVIKRGSTITSLNWKSTTSNTPLYIGIDDIAAVWQIDCKIS